MNRVLLEKCIGAMLVLDAIINDIIVGFGGGETIEF
jgi:hypothetical protein